MKFKIWIIFFLCVVLFSIVYISSGFNVKEEIVPLNTEDIVDTSNVSGEELNFVDENFMTDDGFFYDVVVDDDAITFYDEKGNSIVYVFENNKLQNVLSIFIFNSEDEAQTVHDYYKNLVGNGEITRVTTRENIVSVVLDMKQFEEYKNYTKDEIEEILLNSVQDK